MYHFILFILKFFVQSVSAALSPDQHDQPSRLFSFVIGFLFLLNLPTQAQTPSDSTLAEAHWDMAVCYVIEDSFEQSRHYWQASRAAMERDGQVSLLAQRTNEWVYEWQWTQDRDYLRNECRRSIDFLQNLQQADTSLHYELVLMIGALYREDGLFAQAEAWLLQAQVYATHLKDFAKLGAVKEELGIVHAIRGDRLLAKAFFEEALVLKKQTLGDWDIEISFTENNLGVLATEMGDLPKAIHHMRSSLAITLAQEEVSLWDVAGRLANFGRTFFQLAYLDSARHYFQASLDRYREAGYEDDFHLVVPYTGLAQVANDEGQFELSVAYYDSAREVTIHTQGPDHWEVGVNYSNLGSLHLDWGHQAKARAYLTQALEIYGKSELSLTSGLWGDLYLLMARNSSSPYSKAGMTLVRKAVLSYRDLDLNREVALGMLFHSFMHQQQLDSARFYLRKRWEILNSFSEVPLPRALELHLDRGYLAEKEQNFQQALAHYRQGLKVTRSPDFQSLEAYRAGQSLGELYFTRGEWDSALYYIQVAQHTLAPVSPSSNETGPFQPFPRKMATLLKQEAQIRVELWKQSPHEFFQLDLGLKAIQRALQLTDFELELNWDLPTQQKLGELVRSICEEGMALVHLKWEQEGDSTAWNEAINISERAKAVRLYRGLAQWAAQQELALPISLREEDLRLRRAHIKVQQSLNEAQGLGIPDSNRWLALTQRWQDLSQARQELAERIAQLHPQYAKLSYQGPKLSWQSIQAALMPQQSLVSYFQGEQNVYQLWLLDGELNFLKQEWSPAWSIHAQELAQRKQGDWNQDIPLALSKKLVSPLAFSSSSKRLLVVPDASLNYLPFEALPNPAGEQAQDWLIKHFAIGYTQSLSIWTAAPSIKRDARVAYGGFAPNFEGTQPGIEERAKEVGPLLWAPIEVKQAQEVWGGKAFLGEHCQETQFKAEAPKFQIIHLATHAWVREEDPLASYFLLSPPADSSEDGRLHAYELYNLPLNAQLAVLSACHSGAGPLNQGEGVMSLSRAFAYAGCPSTVVSLWQTNDEVSAWLLEAFYAYLSQGIPKDLALRQAKLDFLADPQTDAYQAQPYFWATLVLWGDPTSIQIPAQSSAWTYIGVLILLIMGIGLAIRFGSGRPQAQIQG